MPASGCHPAHYDQTICSLQSKTGICLPSITYTDIFLRQYIILRVLYNQDCIHILHIGCAFYPAGFKLTPVQNSGQNTCCAVRKKVIGSSDSIFQSTDKSCEWLCDGFWHWNSSTVIPCRKWTDETSYVRVRSNYSVRSDRLTEHAL